MSRAFVFGFVAALSVAALAWRVDAGDGTRSVEDRLSAVEARLGAVEARLAGIASAAAPASARAEGQRAGKASGWDEEEALGSLRSTKVTLEFDQVTVLDALRFVAERGKLNLVMSPAATKRAKEGHVTLALADVAVPVVLRLLTEPNDLSWSVEPYGVVVVRDRSEGDK